MIPTLKQLATLRATTQAFVDRDEWAQGKSNDPGDPHGDGTALVVDPRTHETILDCSGHLDGEQFAAALVAMHNAFPSLLDMSVAYHEQKVVWGQDREEAASLWNIVVMFRRTHPTRCSCNLCTEVEKHSREKHLLGGTP